MTALLELPAFRERVHGLSVEDYHRLGELGILSRDVELLRGIVVTKMPKTPLHELVAQKPGEKDVLVCKSITGIQFTVTEILPASV